MTVKVDGTEYKVAVCDQFAEEASLGKIKELITKKASERSSKLEELQRIAAELGYNLSPTAMNKNALIIPQKIMQPEVQPQQQQAQPQEAPMAIDPGTLKIQKNVRQRTSNDGLSPEEAEAALEAAKSKAERQLIHSPATSQAPSYSSHSLPARMESRDRQGNVVFVDRPTNRSTKLQVVRGREGMPVTIPKTIVASAGKTLIETNINVIDSGGDRTVQNRFKALNLMNERGQNGNYLQQCSVCRGSGITGRNKQTCPKCSGSGFVY